MKRVDVSSAFIYDEDKEKVLIVKNWRGDAFDYTLPGGAVEARETLAEAAVREVKEETGYEIEVGQVAVVSEAYFEAKGHHAVFFTFFGKVVGGEMEIVYPDEIADVQWVDLNTADQLLKHTNLDVSKLVHNKSSAPYLFRGTIKAFEEGKS